MAERLRARPIARAHFERLEELARSGDWPEYEALSCELCNYAAELWLLASRLEDMLEQAGPAELAQFQHSLQPPAFISTRTKVTSS